MVRTKNMIEKMIPNVAEDMKPVTTTAPLLPLKNIVLLPKSIIPIIVGRPRSIKAIEYAVHHHTPLCVTAQKDSAQDTPDRGDLFTTGTAATILQVMNMPKGAVKVLLEGTQRVHISAIEETETGFWQAVYTPVEDVAFTDDVEIHALWRNVKTQYKHYARLSGQVPTNVMMVIQNSDNISTTVDTIAVHSNLSLQDKQGILELVDLKERLMKMSMLLEHEIDILKTEERIRGFVQTQVEKNQREYYLNEQIKAINRELGRDDTYADVATMRTKIDKMGLPKEVLHKVERELRRLEQMPPLSSESAVSKNYIDWILSLPWHATSKDKLSLKQATTVLDKHHFGLQKVKERILEFVAARKFNPKLRRSPILCLVGPPGVGKTSLARSIAASLSREFVRISLGGTRDEAEIRGHRRTYIGALPGKIIQAMGNIKTVNPVILLDEIDKMTHDVYGDPSAALLEVLDPEQNNAFVDNFLEVGYDLSQVMFLTTANHPEGIPYPLYDRLEIITLSGYTDAEKADIAKRFLIPKALKEYGVTATQCKLTTPIIELIISEYTREAGVRQLERMITKVLRKTIQLLLEPGAPATITVTQAQCKKWLGIPPFKKKPLDITGKAVGYATGLAWTELGGDVLEVEATLVSGKGEVMITGQLGDVMQESAQAAVSYIRAHGKALGLKKDFFATHDIHIHVPEGATPKDGPSAGITMCTAVLSAILNIPIRPYLAMTGEITLRGRVLPVGGLKEKLIAAQQNGLKTVLVPADNQDDVDEILEELKLPLTIHGVKTVDEVLKYAFKELPKAPPNGNNNHHEAESPEIPEKPAKKLPKKPKQK